jgi:RNase P/RNase MRP subunit p30
MRGLDYRSESRKYFSKTTFGAQFESPLELTSITPLSSLLQLLGAKYYN